MKNIIKTKTFIKGKKDILKYSYIQGSKFDKKDKLFFDKFPHKKTKFKAVVGYFEVTSSMYGDKKSNTVLVRHRLFDAKRRYNKTKMKERIKEVGIDHFKIKGASAVKFIGYSVSNTNIPKKVSLFYSRLAKNKTKKKKGK